MRGTLGEEEVGQGMRAKEGKSFAYQLYSSGLCEEIGLIDYLAEKAEGEAMDLNHGAYLVDPVNVTSGGYEQCTDADVIVIAGGVPQKPGETRLQLIDKNALVIRDVIEQINASGFDGVIVIASNPVDVLTNIAMKYSNLPKNRVIGTGTTLDTSRFRYMLGEYLDITPTDVDGYILGEHGDTQFAAWSNVRIDGKTFAEYLEAHPEYSMKDAEIIEEKVMKAAYEVINRKRATYYAIGLAMFRIVKAIFRNENVELAVSAYCEGQYGVEDCCIGVPAIIGRDGIKRVVELNLDESELAKMKYSADTLKETLEKAYSVL